MKFNKYLLSVLVGASLTAGITSCNDGEFLEEHSYNFDSNAFYTSQSDMEMAVNACYQEVQYMVMGVMHGLHSWMLMGINYDTYAQTSGTDHFSDWNITATDNGYSRHWYEYTYKLINRANTVIDMIDERDDIQYSTPTKKEELKAAAHFMRGWGYRILAGMFGNVPIVSSSVGTIETGYEAATRQEVWEFCKADFEYAAQHLPINAEKPGQVIRAAADHYLAEICLALGDFDGAVNAATRVINGTDGDYHIMTSRFGSRASEATDRYGNSLAAPAGAYWDLFRQDGNQNSKDNREALWVCQYNYNTYSTGGGGNTWYRARFNVTEPYWLPSACLYKNTKRVKDDGTSVYLFGVNTACFPKYDAEGNEIIGSKVSDVPEANGRHEAGIQRDSMGGNISYVGCGVIIADYVKAPMGQGLWKNGKQGNREDIRGSEIMMQRNWYTPGGTRWYDELAAAIARSEEARVTGVNKNLIINVADTAGISPRLWKFSDDIHHGDNKSYNCDFYLVRVAETHLLLAEAYLAKGDKAKAAEQINIVRDRANAPLCTPAEVNIDYILDERTRELLGEEHRSITLNRLSANPNCVSYISDCYPVQDETTSNTLYERVRKYGYGYPQLKVQPREWDPVGKRYIPNIHPYNYQQPIPTQVIDANISVEYKQNTGY